jgi:hypothetical protein
MGIRTGAELLQSLHDGRAPLFKVEQVLLPCDASGLTGGGFVHPGGGTFAGRWEDLS